VARIHNEHQPRELCAVLKKLDNVPLPRACDAPRHLGEAVAREVHEPAEVSGFKVVESLRAPRRLAGAREFRLAGKAVEHA